MYSEYEIKKDFTSQSLFTYTIIIILIFTCTNK